MITDAVGPFQRFSSASLVFVAIEAKLSLALGTSTLVPFLSPHTLSHGELKRVGHISSSRRVHLYCGLQAAIMVLLDCSVISTLGHPDHTRSCDGARQRRPPRATRPVLASLTVTCGVTVDDCRADSKSAHFHSSPCPVPPFVYLVFTFSPLSLKRTLNYSFWEAV